MVKSGFWRLGLVAVSTALAVVVGFAANASAAKYSSIVIDAQTGQIVSEYNPDSQNYPASLTKMMTLYLTFTALEHHEISMDTRFPVSSHAAAQEPTKLDLIAGETVSVHDLIFGLVTQSANDAAVVLGEGLGGSEPAFAERMTATAHSLGMSNTEFHNASGLPNPYQHTTARDLSTLARHLYLDYPREYSYFATTAFTFRGRTYANHNHLMSSFAGMDGIKTGFINASGFNLAASAVRNGRRLIGVEMGGVSAHARDNKMAQLLNAAFDGRPSPDILMAGTSPQQAREMARNSAVTTPTRSQMASLTFVQPKAGGTKVASNRITLHSIAGRAIASLSPIGRAEAATPSRAVVRWTVQVGAYRAKASAARAGTEARAHATAMHGKPVVVVATRSPHGAVYTARVTGMTQNEAKAACDTLHREHRACTIVGPSLQVAGKAGAVHG